jgi:putative membrane protein
MIVSYRPSWRGIFQQIAKPVAASLVFSVVVVVMYLHGYRQGVFAFPGISVSMFGSALSIFLGFRTSSAYGRWWEARILWGGIVNMSRSWTRMVLSYPHESGRATEHTDEFGREMVRWQIAWVHVLRHHLRQEPFTEETKSLLEQVSGQDLLNQINVPSAMMHRMGKRISEAADEGLLTELRLDALNRALTELTGLQGACERIRSTPFPRQYDYYPAVFIQIYCIIMPLAVIEEYGVFTPLMTFLISTGLLIIDRIGRNLEDPFDSRVYGTSMTAICRTIEIDLRQRLGEENLPKPVMAVKGILE